MNNPTIRIEEVHLDLRGIPQQTAQGALQSLGPAISDALAQLRPASSSTSAAIQAPVDVAPIELSRAIARRVAAAVSGATMTVKPI